MSAGAQTAECTHTDTTSYHVLPSGEIWGRCAVCGKTWGKVKYDDGCIVLAGTRQEFENFVKARRVVDHSTKFYDAVNGGIAGVHCNDLVIVGSFFERPNAHDELQLSKVAINNLSRNPSTYVKLYGLPGWYISSWDTQGDPVLRNDQGKLCCVRCKKECNETYKGGTCGQCPNPNYAPKEQKVSDFNFKPKPKQTFLNVPQTPEHKEGDIWARDKASTPFNAEQWCYKGSAKVPYIVTRYNDKTDGSTTNEGWACSCMSFTRNVPRTPCKHILNVMLRYGFGAPAKSSAKLANVDDAKLAAFEKWQREQAAAKKPGETKPGEVKLKFFGNTGRKFR